MIFRYFYCYRTTRKWKSNTTEAPSSQKETHNQRKKPKLNDRTPPTDLEKKECRTPTALTKRESPGDSPPSSDHEEAAMSRTPVVSSQASEPCLGKEGRS
ncbi:hypothetical protein K458DRAFT_191151 [Lentithecium fluviatile CBS 122367]|uniref:Uncharacterized protein n=1 Tax=Lentithecium fluviatile CBS 122367 TaxID=1168545 RepID=A0A6G1JBC5_9PLEO|nr:hypothetical protein K458DRAFT_191151 [Lentithecium fluviatile CBS 122367]